jgi:Fe-S-cluster containining protein
MPLLERAYFKIDHPVVQRVDPDIFRFTFVADCMTHACRCVDEGVQQDDACCRFGCDVDLYERDRILARASEVARVLAPELRNPARWFDESDPEIDADSPSGVLVRTARHEMEREDGRCVFLQSDGRGCALHRAALEASFDPAEIKPSVCRLYPLSLTEGALGLADDFDWYSCAHHSGPTLYRVMRPTLLELYGADAIAALDRAERRRLGTVLTTSHSRQIPQ